MTKNFGRLQDGTPRDPTKIVETSHTSLYVGILLVAVVIGFALYFFYGAKHSKLRQRGD